MTPVDYEAFLRILACELPAPARTLEGSELLIDDIGLDDLGVFRLFAWLHELQPGFRLPDQFAIEDVRVRDIHHYYALSCRPQS